jgi:CRP-like cAMP-binding protein
MTTRDDHTMRSEDRVTSDLHPALASMIAAISPSAAAAVTLRALADATDSIGAVPFLRIQPFVPGRRSNIEERHPGMGSSDAIAVLTGGPAERNRCILLFDVDPADPRLGVDATIRWLGPTGDVDGRPIAGWDRRRVDLTATSTGARRALVLDPERDFAGEDVGFAHGFLRRAVVELRLTWDGTHIGGDTAEIDVCDIRHLGTLYRRVLDELVTPDTARQAQGWPRASEPPDVTHHPWTPVLVIGMEKAALYTRALIGDIVDKLDHLSDPSWLLRVGIHLELLTCLGIIESVRDEVGDLLSSDERAIFEHSAAWSPIRDRIDPDAWRTVWNLSRISAPRLGMPRAGAVSAMNLIQKKRATLAFLHTHHEDLKQAIELAGPNLRNSQETWQRVFRDAERAVLLKTTEVFPELDHLPAPMRQVVLWQDGVGSQQGLYPTACTQYRASMNDVAKWAARAGLMHYTGDECVPLDVSLIEAVMQDPDRVATLQRGDGYDPDATGVAAERRAAVGDAEPLVDEFEALLAGVPMMSMLSPEERRDLAVGALPLLAVPGERIVVEGDDGDSLFVIADGEVEVLIDVDGTQRRVGLLRRGAVIGEMALLTGEPRTATVRTVDTALILQIDRRDYEPILRAHPEWVDELAEMMRSRLADRQRWLARSAHRSRRRWRRRSTRAIRAQIYAQFFADG